MPQPLDIEIDLPEYDFGKPKAAAPVPAAAPASVATAPAPAPAPRKAAPRKPVAPAAPVAPVAVVKPAPVAPQAKPVTIDVDAIKSGVPTAPKFDLKAPFEMPAGLVPPPAFLPAPTVPSTEAGAGAAAKLPDMSGKAELSGKKVADVELLVLEQHECLRGRSEHGALPPDALVARVGARRVHKVEEVRVPGHADGQWVTRPVVREKRRGPSREFKPAGTSRDEWARDRRQVEFSGDLVLHLRTPSRSRRTSRPRWP